MKQLRFSLPLLCAALALFAGATVLRADAAPYYGGRVYFDDEADLPACTGDAHVFSDWEVTEAPTCSWAGTRQRTCAICGVTQGEFLDPVPDAHVFSEWEVYSEPNCINEGQKERYCEICGVWEYASVPVDPDAHEFGSWTIVQEPTCSSEGRQERECWLCGYVQEQSVEKDPDAHTFGEMTVVVKATCSAEGVQERVCTGCGKKEREALWIDPDAHTFGKWKVITAPTCFEEGYREHTCTACGTTESEWTERLELNEKNAKKALALPEKLDDALRVDNALNQIYMVPQNFEIGELESLLWQAVDGNEIRVKNPDKLRYGEFLVTGVKIEVSHWGYPEYVRTYRVCVRGDCEGSGKSTASDARYALRLSVGLDADKKNARMHCADVDGDGTVTASDARIILRASVRLELLGEDMGTGEIRYYREKEIPAAYAGLAKIVNGAKRTPKKSVPIRFVREKQYYYYNSIAIPAKDMAQIDSLLDGLPASATMMEKIYSLYRYIQGSFDYARDVNTYISISALSPFDAIVNRHLGQCWQYNGAMAEILCYLGYDARIVEGYRGMSAANRWSHYWCEVTIDGKTYLVEVGQPKDNWSGAFMVLYANSDGRYYGWNKTKKAYEVLR